MKKFIVHYETVFEKYDNAVQGSREVKLAEEDKGQINQHKKLML
jgi:hypothetical protein